MAQNYPSRNPTYFQDHISLDTLQPQGYMRFTVGATGDNGAGAPYVLRTPVSLVTFASLTGAGIRPRYAAPGASAPEEVNRYVLQLSDPRPRLQELSQVATDSINLAANQLLVADRLMSDKLYQQQNPPSPPVDADADATDAAALQAFFAQRTSFMFRVAASSAISTSPAPNAPERRLNLPTSAEYVAHVNALHARWQTEGDAVLVTAPPPPFALTQRIDRRTHYNKNGAWQPWPITVRALKPDTALAANVTLAPGDLIVAYFTAEPYKNSDGSHGLALRLRASPKLILSSIVSIPMMATNAHDDDDEALQSMFVPGAAASISTQPVAKKAKTSSDAK